MGMTDGDGCRRHLFFPNDFEYHSEDEKMDNIEYGEDGVVGNFEIHAPPLVLSRRESGNDHSTATSHYSATRSVVMKTSRKSHGIIKKKESSIG